MTKCKECGNEVSTRAKTCPHCGVKDPGKSVGGYIVGTIILIAIVWGLVKCTGSEDGVKSEPKQTAVEKTAFDFTVEGVKSLSRDIQKVSLTSQTTKKGTPDTFLVDIELRKDPFTGGAQDWNSIASDVSDLSKRLFVRPETVRINFTFRSPENNNFDWAYVFVNIDKLPKGWADITYLEFFSFVRPLPGTLQAGQWLCDFYRKYGSAMPQGKLPPSCNLKD